MREDSTVGTSPSRAFAVLLALAALALTAFSGASLANSPASDFDSSAGPWIDAIAGFPANNMQHNISMCAKNRQCVVPDKRVAHLEIVGNGTPQNIYVPQQTILITDDSGSMSWNDPNKIRIQGGKDYVGKLKPVDEAGAVLFHSGLRAQQPLTNNFALVNSTLDRAITSGGTNFEVAFGTANTLMFGWNGGTDKRKPGYTWAYIFLTDGVDSGYPYSDDVDRTIAAQVKVFTIALGADPSQMDMPLLQSIAQRSGGKFYWAKSTADIAAAYNDIAKSISNSYVAKPDRVQIKIANDFEVVGNSFASNIGTGIPNNTGPNPTNPNPLMQWDNVVQKLNIGDKWWVEFEIQHPRSGVWDLQDVNSTYVQYTFFNGTVNRTYFPLLTVKVIAPTELMVYVTATPTSLYSGQNASVRVKVEDGNGPIPGATINMSAQTGTIAPTTGTSNAQGVFQCTFTAPNVASPTLIMIQADVTKAGYISSRGATQVVVSPPSVKLSLAASTRTPWTGDVVKLTVTALDQNNNPLDQALVSMSVSPNASILPQQGMTNAQGVFTADFTSPMVTTSTSFVISATGAKGG
ncbi:MAG TPA: Ig-like domain-containing protein, partial [Thermoplasmata archaeon]|nr:Ig-like domain-containing protein [Thermoplasmata archaeon]